MEIGYIVNELWRRKRWLAIGLIVATFAAMMTVYKIPSFEKKSLELGAASTEVLVDSDQSPIGNLSTPIDVLVVRASLYSRLMESSAVKQRIADELGISPQMIATQGPQPNEENRGREATPGQRASELVTEGNIYRLFAVSGGELPVIQITTQAKTPLEATRVADAAAAGLESYVRDVQTRQDINQNVRVELRQLGPAQGGLVNEGVDLAAAVLAWMGAFGLWCLLVILTPRVLMGLREGQNAWKDHPDGSPDGYAPYDTERAGGVKNGSEPPDDAREPVSSPR